MAKKLDIRILVSSTELMMLFESSSHAYGQKEEFNWSKADSIFYKFWI